MWTLTKLQIAVVCAVFIIAGAVYGGVYALGADARDAARCDALPAVGPSKMACWYRELAKRVQDHSVGRAMVFFSHLYEHYPAFVKEGCHAHSHKLGDIVYFERYLKNPTLEAIDLPQSTTGCGYGFYHGLLEHMVEDSPEPEFVKTTCDYLEKRLGASMRDIRLTCYHGSGHGFTLAQANVVKRADLGKMMQFVTVPLQKCEALEDTEWIEREQCMEGVFNVIITWSAEKRYGFSHDPKRILEPCYTLREEWRRACYYEFAQRIDIETGPQLTDLWRMAQALPDKEYVHTVFGVPISGAVQKTIAHGTYDGLFEACKDLPEQPAQWCVGSLVHGLFEHGSPQEEYKKALVSCATYGPAKSLDKECYQNIADMLPRFYDASMQRRVCGLVPAQWQALCTPSTQGASGKGKV